MTSFEKVLKSLMDLLAQSAGREKVNPIVVRLQDYYSILPDI
jgi:hypothetical protein